MGRKNLADERKPEVYQACWSLFCREGFDNTTFSKIAKEMNVSAGLLTHYFGTKVDLFIETISFIYDRFLMEAYFDNPEVQSFQDPLDKLFYFSESLVSTKMDQFFPDIAYYGSIYMGLRNEKINKTLANLTDKLHQIFTALLEEHFQKFPNKIKDTHAIASLILFLLDGLDLHHVIAPDRFDRKENFKAIKKAIELIIA